MDACNDVLNVAYYAVPIHTLGPGARCGIWLQGCPFRCAGCVSPHLIPEKPARPMTAAELLGTVRAFDGLEGVTLSGGDPFAQATALATFLELLRQETALSVIVYTGFEHAELQRLARSQPAIARALQQIDLLIDGRYEHARNTGRGLMGSSNQRLLPLSPRYAPLVDDLREQPRRLEFFDHPADVDTRIAVGLPTLEQWRYVASDPDQRRWYEDAAIAGGGR